MCNCNCFILWVYTTIAIVVILIFCHSKKVASEFIIKTKFITFKEKKDIEHDIFGENDNNECYLTPFEILNEITKDKKNAEYKLNELRNYYEKREEYFDEQHRDFLQKLSLYFQMYIFSWGYIGALIVFLLTGNNENAYTLMKNIHIIVIFLLLIVVHFIFFIQVLMALSFISDYTTDGKNSIFKNVLKEKFEYLKRIVQNKAYAYNCNDVLLEKIKATLKLTPIKFIVILFAITILATIIICNR